VRSDKDVELPEGAGDDEYLHALGQWLPYLTATLRPDLIFYQGGVDVHKCVGERCARENGAILLRFLTPLSPVSRLDCPCRDPSSFAPPSLPHPPACPSFLPAAAAGTTASASSNSRAPA